MLDVKQIDKEKNAVSMWKPSEYDGESLERDYAEREIEQDETRLRERLAEEEIHLIEAANGWTHAVRARRALLADDLDPETGCTAAEIREEETGQACPVEREIHDGVRTRRQLREDAVCFKGKVA